MTQPRLRRPDGTCPRALVVDDEPTPAELPSIALRHAGWDVRSAANIVALDVAHLHTKIDAGRARMIHTVRGARHVLDPEIEHA